MRKENYIPANEFCSNHNIEISFLRSLEETGLIEITKFEDKGYVRESQLRELEKIVHLYFELDINIEGIDTINHLLKKIDNLQNEIIMLKNKIRFYDPDEI